MKRKKYTANDFFLKKAISHEVKNSRLEFNDLAWLKKLPVDEAFWIRWMGISSLITAELRRKKLWHDDYDKTVAPLENGIPSLIKRKTYRVEGEEFDENLEYTESLDDIFGVGAITEDFLVEVDEDIIFQEENLEDAGENIHPYLPRLAAPPTHALMRRYPLDLRESLARELFDSSYFLFKDKHLLPALCFFEVGISDRKTFYKIRQIVYRRGPFSKHKKFGFDEYNRDKLKLFHFLKGAKRRYFDTNPWLKVIPKKQRETLWERFEAACNSLTPKQWNSLKQVRVKRRKQSSVAKGMRISLDSLRDRIEGAELKFRKALPEFANFSPSETYKKNAKSNYIYSGLWDRREAQKIAPLYQIDLKTGKKTKIAPYKGERKNKKNVNPALVKAWAHDSTPVPDFSFTDYFTQLYAPGAINRMMGSETAHDRSSGRYSFAIKSKAHKSRRSSSD